MTPWRLIFQAGAQGVTGTPTLEVAFKKNPVRARMDEAGVAPGHVIHDAITALEAGAAAGAPGAPGAGGAPAGPTVTAMTPLDLMNECEGTHCLQMGMLLSLGFGA